MMSHSGLSPRHMLGDSSRYGFDRPARGYYRYRDDADGGWTPPTLTPAQTHASAVAAFASARAYLARVNKGPAWRRAADRAEAFRWLNRARRDLHRAADALAAEPVAYAEAA